MSTSLGISFPSQHVISPATSLPVPEPPMSLAGQKLEQEDSIYSIRRVYVSCIFCEAQVTTDLACHAKLRMVVSQDRFIKILASYGILFDQHLDILFRMDNRLKITLFQNFQMGGISPLTKFQLYRLFSTSRKPSIPARAPMDVPFISPPSLEIQRKLSSSGLSTTDFGPLLKNAMKLDNDDRTFDDILVTALIV